MGALDPTTTDDLRDPELREMLGLDPLEPTGPEEPAAPAVAADRQLSSSDEAARQRLTALDRSAPWAPQPGPQLQAFVSPADQLLYGGAAGSGKSSLAVGLAITMHRRTLMLREEATQLLPVVDEIASILGTRDGYNGQDRIWRLPGGRQIQFGGVADPGSEQRYQGNPRDLAVYDECAAIREDAVRFTLGWLRTTTPGQRCRALFCTNPPSTAAGEWVLRWWAPWLDENFPNPAKPGELRWVAMIPGEGERWVESGEPFTLGKERIRPVSRTFVPGRIGDNAYLRDTAYLKQLQAMPEPLRSQLLHGSWTAGRHDDDWQTVPSAWIKAAMDRWSPSDTPGDITSVGVDPSRGGPDETIVSTRRGWRFDPLLAVPAHVAAHGGAVAQRVLAVAGDIAPIHIDVIGIGASVYDHLEAFVGRRAVPVNFATASDEKDATGNLKFVNTRAAAWWRFRELLDPSRGLRVALPRDARLAADLAAPRYRMTARGIQIEDKTEVKKRLGRSPDRGDAVVLASFRTPAMRLISGGGSFFGG